MSLMGLLERSWWNVVNLLSMFWFMWKLTTVPTLMGMSLKSHAIRLGLPPSLPEER